MADPVRFYLDQHIPVMIAHGLRHRGVDVLMAGEAGRCGVADAGQLEFATAEKRVLITRDADFLQIAANGLEHFGIAYCHVTKYSARQLLQVLLVLHGVMDREGMRNQVEYL